MLTDAIVLMGLGVVAFLLPLSSGFRHWQVDDLAVEGNLESEEASRYAYAVYHGGTLLAEGTADDPALAFPSLPASAHASSDPDDHVLRAEIRTLRDGQRPSKRTTIYLHLPPGGEPRVVGIERET